MQYLKLIFINIERKKEILLENSISKEFPEKNVFFEDEII